MVFIIKYCTVCYFKFTSMNIKEELLNAVLHHISNIKLK